MKLKPILWLVFFVLCISLVSAQDDDSQTVDIQTVIKSAESGNIEAMWELGERLWDGNGTEVSLEKAWQWWKKAAEKGSSDDIHEYGVRIKELGLHADAELNQKEAFACFQKAAEAGSVSGMSALGECYRNGEGVQQNIKKAVEWYEKAAAKKDADALLALGEMSEEGLGMDMSLAKAVYFYTRAAEQGSEDARFFLGYMYFEGRGVDKDLTKALELLKQAARGDQVDAQFELAKCYEGGIGVEKNDIAAVKWLKKAVSQFHYEARYHLANHYYEGLGVAKNLIKAYLLLHNLGDYEPATDGDPSPVTIAGPELFKKVTSEMTPEQLEEAKREAAKGPIDESAEEPL